MLLRNTHINVDIADILHYEKIPYDNQSLKNMTSDSLKTPRWVSVQPRCWFLDFPDLFRTT
jgi:hypothetical protein